MSYADTNHNFEPLLRVLWGTLDFRGRARRGDGILYYFLATLLLVVLSFALGPIVSFETQSLITWVLGIILPVPLVAWFVRRAHDYDLRGWWLLAFLGWGIARPLAEFWGLDFAVILDSWAYMVANIAVVIAIFAAIFWPPSKGANRFGPNPRCDAAIIETAKGNAAQ